MALAGRINEMRDLADRLEAAKQSRGSTVLVEGVAGIGKSRLVEELSGVAASRGFLVLRGSGQQFATFPYRLFDEALGPHLSEPLVPTTAMTRFSEIFAITRSGMLLAHAHIGGGMPVDSDILAGMLTAVQNFVKDSFGDSGSDSAGLNRLEYKKKKILIEYMGAFYLTGVIEGEEHPAMQNELAAVANRIEKESGDKLERRNMTGMDGVEYELNLLLQQSWHVMRAPADINIDIERLKLYDRALNLTLDLAAERPVLLVLEDMHWTDEGSLGMLLYVARNTRFAKVLILGTLRPERGKALEKTLERMGTEELHTTLELGGLRETDVGTLAAALLGAPLSGKLSNALYSRCEGNPLFARELVECGRRDGALMLSDGTWTLRPDTALAAASIEELIEKRLHSLSPDCFYIMDICACLGREFDFAYLAQICGGDAPALEGLSPLIAHGILVRAGNTVRFEHPLVHETSYKSTGARRCAHHRRIAEVLENSQAKNLDEVLYEIAYHFGKSDMPEKSLEFNERAGDKAVSEHAVERAAAFYMVSLDAIVAMPAKLDYEGKRIILLEKLGEICMLGGMFETAMESFEKVREATQNDETMVRMLRRIGDLHEKKGEYDKAIEILAEAKSSIGEGSVEYGRILLSEGYPFWRKGDYEKAMALFLEAIRVSMKAGTDQKTIGNALKSAGNIHLSRGEYDSALEYYVKGLAVMEIIGEQHGIAAVLNNMGIVHRGKGKLTSALELFGRSLEIRENIGDTQGIAVSLGNIGLIHNDRGEMDLALECHKRGLQILEKIGDKRGMAAFMNNISSVHHDRGELDSALEFYGRSLEILKKIGDKGGIALLLHNIGLVHTDKGEMNRALDFHGRCLEICREIDDKIMSSHAHCGIAEAYLRLKKHREALEHSEKAIEIAVEIGEKVVEGLGYRILAMAHRDMNAWEKAVENFNRGQNIFGEIGDHREHAKTFYEYGLMWKAKGDPEKAKECLGKALSEFEHLGMKLWAEKCRKALDGL